MAARRQPEWSKCDVDMNVNFRILSRFLALSIVTFSLPAWSQSLSSGDDDLSRYHLRRALSALDGGNVATASGHIAQSGEALAERYLLWRQLQDDELDFPLQAYQSFLKNYSYWPHLRKVRIRLEESLDPDRDPGAVLGYFSNERPVSETGRVALAIALKRSGRADEATEIVRKIWHNDDLDRKQERILLDSFGKTLRRSDHEMRLSNLLWDRQSTSAKRLFGLVGNGHRKLAAARIALQASSRGVDRAINAVPRSLRNDPGLLFDRLRWRRGKDLYTGARQILQNPPESLGRPARWWRERAFQIRELIESGKLNPAYELAKRHGQSTGLAFTEAEWLAGWLALRAAGRPDEALKRFNRLFEHVSTPISRGRAAYWAGRSAMQLGDKALAMTWFERAASYPTSFYGQEAAAELLVGLEAKLPENPSKATPSTQQIAELQKVAHMLCRVDAGSRAMPFWRRMLDFENQNPDLAIAEAASCGRPDLAIVLGKRALRTGRVDPLTTFPVAIVGQLLNPKRGDPDPALLLAIARQESHFDVAARSGAGAMGLMQLMPATARAVAKREGLAFSKERLLREPELNATLGSAYLRRLLERYNGAVDLVAAAYNAGPGRVEKWIRLYGDPRRMSRHDRLDWIEKIPFSETRNYVQRVSEGYRIYEYLLKQENHWRVSPRKSVGPLIPAPIPKANPRTS